MGLSVEALDGRQMTPNKLISKAIIRLDILLRSILINPNVTVIKAL